MNFFGGPGSGKSTTAAQTFGYLKMAGVNCELVTEFAKDMTWDGSHACLGYQPYVFGQQAWRLERLEGKVDVVVTDSPLLLSRVYAPPSLPQSFRDFVVWEHGRRPSMNFRLRRVKAYNPVGRNQTEGEAKDLDGRISDVLDDVGVSTTPIAGDGTAPVLAFGKVMQALDKAPTPIVMPEDEQPDLPSLFDPPGAVVGGIMPYDPAKGLPVMKAVTSPFWQAEQTIALAMRSPPYPVPDRLVPRQVCLTENDRPFWQPDVC